MEKTKTPSHPVSRAKRGIFLAELSRTGDLKRACEVAGISLQTPRQWCHRSQTFAEAYRISKEQGDAVLLATLEAEVKRRALAGPSDPGSTNLLMFRVKRLDPAYRENALINVQMGPVAIQFAMESEPIDVTPGNAPLPAPGRTFGE